MSEKDVIIRSLLESDLSAALAIQSAVYPSFLVEPAEAFESRLRVSVQFCLAATFDGKLAAYLLAHGWPRQSPPPIGTVLSPLAFSEVLFIHDLAVAPHGRGLRLGGKLVKRAFELAARRKLDHAELIAVQGAAAYWRTLGFNEADVSAQLGATLAMYGKDARWMTREIPMLANS